MINLVVIRTIMLLGQNFFKGLSLEEDSRKTILCGCISHQIPSYLSANMCWVAVQIICDH
jgi:hypothetical protein